MAGSEGQPRVQVTVVGLTDVGRVREHNEDAFLVLDRDAGRRAGNGEQFDLTLGSAVIFAVADGMGGAAAGEVASRMASDRLASVLGAADYTDATPDQIVALMDTAIHGANEEILTEARENVERKGMGTTLTAAVAVPGRVYISQVGDSRGYLLRKGKVVQLTKDQSLIGQLIEEGTLTEEEAEKLGGKNIVLQAVGVEENLRVDTKHWEMLRGDVILVCSDGLTGMIKDAEVETILNECGGDLPGALKRLIEAANANGGRDNITAVLARFEGEGLRAPMEALVAGGVEKAGAGFAAPPPPEVPNPMKKVGAALVAIIALILLAFFLSGSNDLTVELTPRDVDVVVTLEDGSGNVVHDAGTVRSTATFTGLDAGATYVVTATASSDDYFVARKKLTLSDTGNAKDSLVLTPKPGAITIRVKTAHVRVHVDAPGGGAPGVTPIDEGFDHADPGTAKRYEQGVPAGVVRVRVTRDGFEPQEMQQNLAPNGDLTFEVPELKPRYGKLSVTAPGPDFEVVVVDALGAELARGTTDASGHLLLENVREVKSGRHEVRASRAGYEEFRTEMSLAAGEVTEVVVEAAQQKVSVTVTGVPGTLFRIQQQTESGWELVGSLRSIADSGQLLRALRLQPGSYRATWGDDKVLAFEIEAGEADKQLRLE